VLTNGAIAAVVLVDAVVAVAARRALARAVRERRQFQSGLLEGPQYTRPPSSGLEGSGSLVVGNHGEIATWRKQGSVCGAHERIAPTC